MAVNHSCLSSGTILISSFVLFYITMGTAQSFGVIYSELLDQFQSGKGETSWIPSLSTGMLMGLGPIAGYLEQKYGCRTIAIVGSITMATGMFCSGFVTSLYLLYLTYGVICGIGFGLTFLVANVVVPFHFDKRLSVATAFASAGGGVGTITTPLISRVWLKEYDWRGTFILMASVALQGVICGAILYTPNSNRKDTATIKTPQDDNFVDSVKTIFNNKEFDIFTLSSFIVTLGYFTIYVILPNAVETKGLSKDEAAVLITCAGISGLIGRLLVGIIADKQEVNRCILNGVALLFVGFATVSCSFIESYELFLVYSSLLGILLGTFAFLQGVITVDLVGRKLLSLAFGFLAFFQAISVTVGPPAVGWLVDVTGRYDEAFYCIGGAFLLGGLLSFFIPLYQNYTKIVFCKQKTVINLSIISESTYL